MVGGVAGVLAVVVVAVTAQSGSNGEGPRVTFAAPPTSRTSPATVTGVASDARLIVGNERGVFETTRGGSRRLSDIAGVRIAYQLSDASLVVERTDPTAAGSGPTIHRVVNGLPQEISVLRGRGLSRRRGPGLGRR